MKKYRVCWTMEIDADTFKQAAEFALIIHRDPESIATEFEVTDMRTSLCKRIDLDDVEIPKELK